MCKLSVKTPCSNSRTHTHTHTHTQKQQQQQHMYTPQDADQQVHPTDSWPDRLSRLGYKLFPASPPPHPLLSPPTHPFPAVPRSSVATPSVPHRSQYGDTGWRTVRHFYTHVHGVRAEGVGGAGVGWGWRSVVCLKC